MSKFKYFVAAAGFVLWARVGLASDAQPEYARFVFTPGLREASVESDLTLDQLEVFAVYGQPREPAFMRSRFHARLGERAVEIASGEQLMRYYVLDQYRGVQRALLNQARHFAELIGAPAPKGLSLEVTDDVVFAAAWFTNYQRAVAQIQKSGPNLFVISGVTLVATREDFARPASARPINVVLQLVRWDSGHTGALEHRERVIMGVMRQSEVSAADRRAIEFERAELGCERTFLN